MTEKQIAELKALYKALNESAHAPFMAYNKATDKSDAIKLSYGVYESALSAFLNLVERELFYDNLAKLKAKEEAE